MITQIKREITQIFLLMTFLLAVGCQQKPALQDQVLVEDAEDWINAQDYDKARNNLLRAAEINPRNLKAYVLLGDVYYFQSNVIMFRMQILNLVFKYGRRLRWATPKELDLATPTEELLVAGMNSYQKALELIKGGVFEPTVEASYLNYELAWGYLAKDDLPKAREHFNAAIVNGQDRWDAKRAFAYLSYLDQKVIDQKNQEKLKQAQQELLKKKEKKPKK